MKFKLFGDLDCPDWIIAHINSLSRLSSIKLKMLCNEVVKDIISKPAFSADSIDILDLDKVLKITADAKFDEPDARAVFAVLSYILRSAWKFEVDPGVLGNELQQLGLPKEHSASLTKVYSEKSDEARNALRSQSLRRK